ncbi:hypothetical protein [Streptomyces sp. NPDC056661]|uniref:hypothetical protein n=1 Tax=Streptomyces sp. NPDC056661 TaxID=3345898 RepID=UPI0036A8F178
MPCRQQGASPRCRSARIHPIRGRPSASRCTANAVLNITALRQQRAALGDEEFTRLLGRHFDEASVSAVLSLTAMLPTTGGRSGQVR